MAYFKVNIRPQRNYNTCKYSKGLKVYSYECKPAVQGIYIRLQTARKMWLGKFFFRKPTISTKGNFIV